MTGGVIRSIPLLDPIVESFPLLILVGFDAATQSATQCWFRCSHSWAGRMKGKTKPNEMDFILTKIGPFTKLSRIARISAYWCIN